MKLKLITEIVLKLLKPIEVNCRQSRNKLFISVTCSVFIFLKSMDFKAPHE